MPLRSDLSDLRGRLQGDLFPALAAAIGPLTAKKQQFVTVLEMVSVASLLPATPGLPGRPPADRVALARCFIAKAVLGIQTTALLIERLASDKTLRQLCGWPECRRLPSESTFSRAFEEFTNAELPARLHQALIVETHADRLVGHVARDSTAIEAREKPVKVEAPKRCRKKQRPQKGEPGWEGVRRLERQQAMTLEEMIADLPKHCSIGCKKNAKGHQMFWNGYKLHIDTGDGDIPLSALLSSASLHDSQAAIPLMKMTAERVTSLYDVMDSAYDAAEIKAACRALGHVPIIKQQTRSNSALGAELAAEARARFHANYRTAEDIRFNARSAAERVNGRLMDEFGGCHVRVRGAAKVMCHLMFGILVLTVDQLMRLVT